MKCKEKPLMLRCLGAVFAALFSLMTLALSVGFVGLNPDFYRRSFTRYNVAIRGPITTADALRIAEAIPAFLRGDDQALTLDVTVAGVVQRAFLEDELTHMRDVQGLFALSGTVWKAALCLMIAVFLAARMLCPRERRRFFWQGSLIALGLLAGLVSALAVWAVVDFSTLFVLFHKISFANDLWQMDPNTQLMIRLMPEQMFADGAVQIGFLWALMLLGLGVWAVYRLRRKGRV